MLDGVGDCLSPARDLELGEDVADMGFYGGNTNDHHLCDLLVALTLYHQIQHLHLSFGQVKPGMFHRTGCMNERLGGFRGKRRFA